MRFIHLKQQNTSYNVHNEGKNSRTWMGSLMGIQWGGDGGPRRAGSGLGKGVQRDFHSDLKEGKS